MNSEELIKIIAESPKRTPIKVYIRGNLVKIDLTNYRYFGGLTNGVLFCPAEKFDLLLKQNGQYIYDFVIESDRRNSALPLSDLTKFNARIEPGAIIRDLVDIGDNSIIMMGAVINIGAIIGKGTMVDMNAVIGGRAIVGNNCHIGAGAVLAGVIEPPSAVPVTIEEDVLIGANAVVLEGIKVGKGAVVAAGSVVVNDVEPFTVVAGVPAKVIKKVDEITKSKTAIIDALRKL